MNPLALIPGVGPVLAYFAANRWARRLAAGAGLLLAVLLLVFGIYQKGRHDERVAQAQAIAAANARAELRAAAATAAAAGERAADQAAISAAAKGRTDAIHAGPDETPSGPELRLNRERLCAPGAPTADLAACR